MDWVRHTTVIAALVAAAGLAVTAWGTAKSAQVADDQLEQSREEQEKEERAQASAVTAWLEGLAEGDETLIIANRSLYPVPVAVDGMRKWDKEPVTDSEGNSIITTVSQEHTIALGVLPPCTRVTLSHDLLLKHSTDVKAPDDFDPSLIFFMDATGQHWQRGLSGKLKPRPDLDQKLPPAFYEFDELDVGTPIRETKRVKLTPCPAQ
ncbi:hypothetical protein [Streptomyces echinatus]|uniref:hypothetical protein n=1 Tax=Streptomyces echinatus TaxID=67293 RepID=UPI00379034D5